MPSQMPGATCSTVTSLDTRNGQTARMTVPVGVVMVTSAAPPIDAGAAAHNAAFAAFRHLSR